jgi:hypothetical protein
MTTFRFLPDEPCAHAGTDGSACAPSAIAAICANLRRLISLCDIDTYLLRASAIAALATDVMSV